MLLKLLLVHVLCHVVISKDQIINIAGIFEDNSVLKKAFLYAVDIVNDDDSYIPTIKPILDNAILTNNPFSALNGTCALLRKGVAGIFGAMSKSNIEIVQSICDTKEIPHVLTSWEGAIEQDWQINAHPRPSLLSEAYVDILNGLEWTSFTFIYTDQDSLFKLSEFIGKAKDAGIKVYVENLNEYGSDDYRPVLEKLRELQTKHFVLDCQIGQLNEVLVQIQQMGLLSVGHNYFLTNLDAHQEDLTRFSYSGANITGVCLINPQAELVKNVSEELSNIIEYYYPASSWNLGSGTALIIDAVNMFTNALKDLNISETKNLDCSSDDFWEEGLSIFNILKASSYEGITGKMQFGKDGYRNVFELNIFQLNKDGIVEKGTWNTTTGLSLKEDDSTALDDLDSLKSKHLVVGITLTEPYAMLVESVNDLTGNDRYEGFAIDLIYEISNIINFNYTFTVRHDFKNGVFDRNTGRWSGMIGDLIEGKTDLAISDMTITAERSEGIDFTVPFMSLGISILFQKPLLSPPDFWHFATNFSSNFWTALAIAYLAVNVTLYVVGRLSPNEWEKDRSCRNGEKHQVNHLSLHNTIWFVTGGLLRQGTQVRVRSIPSRIIAGSWWLVCFVTISMYISSLVMVRAVPNYMPLFTDVQSLVDASEEHQIRYGAKFAGTTVAFFQNSDSVLYQEIYEHMLEHSEDMVSSTFEAIARAENERYAFFMESPTLEYITHRHCSLMQYGGLLDERGYGIALRKGSPYLKNISTAILKLQATGKLPELKKKWWEDKRGGHVCSYDDDLSEFTSPMNLEDIRGLIWITITGTLLAFLLGLLEFSKYVNKLSRYLKVPFKKAFVHEMKRSLTRNSKRRVRGEVLIPNERENDHDGAPETVELT